ncbi:mitochondrial ribosomal subunit S27-domain-containing protein [Lineolata rhizophorae]|uniref:Small ribosomal subunit protein mS33 n=1 Tax=Lineolata rhizophorae TaxID=578093 RepID=A0A6A6NZ28_9PEZI|nr:mitochondrial ribosomal subunit S27-domain-containing protein [Lineolata rhizophorae]
MAVPRGRILDLAKVQCRIFNTTFNPDGLRTGNKILRQRLKGASIADYYPRRGPTTRDLARLYPGLETYNDYEEERFEHIQITKSRGKGSPPKKREPNQFKKK